MLEHGKGALAQIANDPRTDASATLWAKNVNTTSDYLSQKKKLITPPPKNYTYVVYRKMDGCTYNVFHVCRRVWHDKMWQAQTQLCSSQRLKVASMTPAAGKQHPGTFICTTQRSLVCRCWTPKGKVLYECLWGGVFLFCFFFYFGGFNQRVGWWMQTTC